VKAFILTAAMAILGGCVSVPRSNSLAVEEVVQNIHAWDGREVWLGKCRGLDCAIYASLDDARRIGPIYDNGDWRAVMARSLSIGFDKDFDKRAAPLQFKKVRLRGRISDECSGDNICTDRAPDIYPISIEPA
jgi:hypothetical protein